MTQCLQEIKTILKHQEQNNQEFQDADNRSSQDFALEMFMDRQVEINKILIKLLEKGIVKPEGLKL